LKIGSGRAVLCQAAPWHFDYKAKPYLRTTFRRDAFLVSRLLSNAGAELKTGLLESFSMVPASLRIDISKDWRFMDEPSAPDAAAKFQEPSFDDSSWAKTEIPNRFENLGVRWYRLSFETPKEMPEDSVTLSLGPVDDESWVWLNGSFLGEITKANTPKDYYSHPRDYKLPKGLLKKGEPNVVAVKVNNTYLAGGMTGVPALVDKDGGPWLKSYYLQAPEPEDDPYRFYPW